MDTLEKLLRSEGRLKPQAQNNNTLRTLTGEAKPPAQNKGRSEGDTLRLLIGDVETYKPPNPYAGARSEYQSILGASSYQLTYEQLNALMGTGSKLPQRQEELTLTIGSRSARRVTPQSNSLTLGVRS